MDDEGPCSAFTRPDDDDVLIDAAYRDHIETLNAAIKGLEKMLAVGDAERNRLRYRLSDVENERNREREHRVDEAQRHLRTMTERDGLRTGLKLVVAVTDIDVAHGYARAALDLDEEASDG